MQSNRVIEGVTQAQVEDLVSLVFAVGWAITGLKPVRSKIDPLQLRLGAGAGLPCQSRVTNCPGRRLHGVARVIGVGGSANHPIRILVLREAQCAIDAPSLVQLSAQCKLNALMKGLSCIHRGRYIRGQVPLRYQVIVFLKAVRNDVVVENIGRTTHAKFCLLSANWLQAQCKQSLRTCTRIAAVAACAEQLRFRRYPESMIV